jgi:hypothetical protein
VAALESMLLVSSKVILTDSVSTARGITPIRGQTATTGVDCSQLGDCVGIEFVG